MAKEDTREHIKQVALELFTRRGYEKTSLREIAEHLSVTKAAIYYHFRRKEDIATALFEEWVGPVEEILEWAQAAPPSLTTKREVLRRYGAALAQAGPLSGLFAANAADLRNLDVGMAFQNTLASVAALITEDGTSLYHQLRSISALLVLHVPVTGMQGIEGTPQEHQAAALDVALDLLASAHCQAGTGSSSTACATSSPHRGREPSADR